MGDDAVGQFGREQHELAADGLPVGGGVVFHARECSAVFMSSLLVQGCEKTPPEATLRTF